METNERASIVDVLQLARQIAAQLEPLTVSATDTRGLYLRLAQAHALGLVDQLSEIVSTPRTPAQSPQTPNGRPREDEPLRTW